MKIGLIVYSQTGNTLSVAQKLEERLRAAGLSVQLEQVAVAAGGSAGKAQLVQAPDVRQYDAIAFGAPVQAFSLAAAMKRYLAGIGPLQGKPVVALVTQQLRYPWLGGNQAVRQLRQACQRRGADFRGAADIHWSSPDREQQIAEAVDRLSRLLSSNS